MVSARKSDCMEFDLVKARVSSAFTKNLEMLAEEAEKGLLKYNTDQRATPLQSYTQTINYAKAFLEEPKEDEKKPTLISEPTVIMPKINSLTNNLGLKVFLMTTNDRY